MRSMMERMANSVSRRRRSLCRRFPTAISRMSRITDNGCSIANIARSEMMSGRLSVQVKDGFTMGESASIAADHLHPRGITPPLQRIADHCAIFLNFDGTLLNRERRPDQVAVNGCLLYLLDDLYVATAGATAIISG